MTANEATECVNCLGDLDYPANREDLVRIARTDGATPTALRAFEGLPDQNFSGRYAIRTALLSAAA